MKVRVQLQYEWPLRKLKGAATYKSKYKEEWSSLYPVGPANGNEYAFYCIPCKKNISCSHQGLGDVKQHIQGKGHQKMASLIKENRKITFQPASSSISDAQIRAEVLHTNFIVQHNLSFLTADHLAPLYAKMFPDSSTAKSFKCSRTKTTSILNEAIYPTLHSNLIKYMAENPYAMVNDGSSDTGLLNMNPVCVYIFDIERSKQVEFKFYSMCLTSGEDCSKSQTLFDSINNTMTKDNLDWDNVVAIGLDNTNVNIGNKNSLKTRILEENPAGCNCHLAHIAAGKGGEGYASQTKFDCEDHLVDLYYFFKRSTCRKGILAEYFEFVGCDWENLTRFVSTRWLSLGQCCDKEFWKFEGLKSMFLSRIEANSRCDIDEGLDADGKYPI